MSQKANKDRAYRVETEKNDQGEVIRTQVVFEDEEPSKSVARRKAIQTDNQSSE